MRIIRKFNKNLQLLKELQKQTLLLANVIVKNKRWPTAWTEYQQAEFLNRYPWLIGKNGKLGCEICKSVRNLGALGEEKLSISREWSQCLVGASG